MILDSFAWIELINGTEKGGIVKDYLKSKMCYTAITSLSEVVNACLMTGRDPNFPILAILSSSKILPLDNLTAVNAGKINFERKRTVKNWGMMDSFILAFAISRNLQILTGDKQFSDLPNVVLI